MIREIVIYGDPVLRKKCDLVKNFSEDIHSLVEDMLETMVSAEGIGLAAPQIGVPTQLAVVDVSHDPECISYLRVDGKDVDLVDMMPLIFANPELEFDGEQDVMTEGCLSFPEIQGEVTRPYEVKAKVKLINVNNDIELKKFLKQTAYGEKIYIGMGAGSISNWMKNLKNNI